MALTPEQIKRRMTSIGGSDANTLMSGDKERIRNLWLEKRGEREPDDLSDVLMVQMGSFTEPLNISWFEKISGKTVKDQQAERSSFDEPFMSCTLDGMVWEDE
jgi:predicted phage-related endonuclease